MEATLRQRGLRDIARGIGRISELVIDKAEGSYVTTVGGKRFLDYTSGIGVVNLGHCHPRVTEAAVSQMSRLVHGQVNIFLHRPMIELTEKLKEVMPAPSSLDTFFFANSGAEAVENSIKLARHATGKPNVVVFQGGYHGRSIGTMSLTTSKTIYRSKFGPLMPGVFVVPFPYCLHCPGYDKNKTTDTCCLAPMTQLDLLLKQQTTADETCAVLIEPVLGEGGYVVPPPGFLADLRAWCTRHDILLIADEVQSGFGRTGKMFAVEHWGVDPDILVMAKGIANGFPLSAIASRKELMDKQPPGSMGGTYAGNPVACSAALSVLEVFKEENVLANCNRQGSKLKAGLEALQSHANPRVSSKIAQVRGLGLMLALELKDVPYGTATKISQACLGRGLLLLTTSAYETLRFVPPLTISDEDVSLGLQIFTEAAVEVLSGIE